MLYLQGISDRFRDARGQCTVLFSLLGVQVGDRVFFWQLTAAAFAEKALIEETYAGALGELSFEQGAAIGWPYFTAIRAIQQLCASHLLYIFYNTLVNGVSSARIFSM